MADPSERTAVLTHLYALVAAIDAEPLHPRDHSQDVSAYSAAIGRELGLDDERLVPLRRAAFFHDLGKIAVSRSTLSKPAALDEREWAEIRTHPRIGAAMLVHAGLHREARWVAQHHEHLDGCGYPEGLAGDEIALEARIILVAEALQAMTGDRPYRRGMQVAQALAELHRCAGTEFDPEVVGALERAIESGELHGLAPGRAGMTTG